MIRTKLPSKGKDDTKCRNEKRKIKYEYHDHNVSVYSMRHNTCHTIIKLNKYYHTQHNSLYGYKINKKLINFEMT